jgi:hypothetical protein
MFAGLFATQMVVRLPADERLSMMADQDAKPLEPMPGRPMKDLIIVPTALMIRETAFKALVVLAMTFGASLPPKKTGGKGSSFGKGAKRS